MNSVEQRLPLPAGLDRLERLALANPQQPEGGFLEAPRSRRQTENFNQSSSSAARPSAIKRSALYSRVALLRHAGFLHAIIGVAAVKSDLDAGGELRADAAERSGFLGVAVVACEQAGLHGAEYGGLARFVRRAQQIEARPSPRTTCRLRNRPTPSTAIWVMIIAPDR